MNVMFKIDNEYIQPLLMEQFFGVTRDSCCSAKEWDIKSVLPLIDARSASRKREKLESFEQEQQQLFLWGRSVMF